MGQLQTKTELQLQNGLMVTPDGKPFTGVDLWEDGSRFHYHEGVLYMEIRPRLDDEEFWVSSELAEMYD